MSRSMTNGHAPAPSISELARTHGVHRRTIVRWQKNGWSPAAPIVQQDQDARRDAHPPSRILGAASAPVDLVALKRDIKEWGALHAKVERLKVRQRRDQRLDHISWQVCRFTFLIIGAAFFALLAYAAVT
jgi:hypothetical protein